MNNYTIDETQKLGGFLLPDGKLSFQGEFYSKCGSYPENSDRFLSKMEETYRKTGISCLFIRNDGMVTIWKKFHALSPVPVIMPCKQYTIAQIDDSPIEGKIMGAILETLDCKFETINDPLLAVAKLIKIRPDLILLDLNMPIVNGYEICAQLRRVDMFKEVPIIIVTANNSVVDRVRAKMSGASDFISKPIHREKITSLLSKHLQIHFTLPV